MGKSSSSSKDWSEGEFVAQLRAVGAERYHHLHPFHLRMNRGELSREEVRSWAANRFYYQRSIPLKDAAILSNCPLREVRRSWIRRIVDHDGAQGAEGGIEAWLKLAEATGLTREETLSECHVQPAVRFACDAYVTFARTKPWPIAVASSLTELFAPDLMSERLAAFERHYPWVSPDGLTYFRQRLTRAPKDSEEALRLTLDHCRTRADQEEAVAALEFKCDVLWVMLDGLTPAQPGKA
jgi:pyrroloquinoline-quinone synthase